MTDYDESQPPFNSYWYERGHQDGESCANADWILALDGVIPDEVLNTGSAYKVARYLESLLDSL